MTIPNLPTDSLYKYMAIGGIAIAIFSAYFLNDISSKKMESKRALIKEIELLHYEFKQEENPNMDRLKQLGRKMVERSNDVEALQDSIQYNNGLRYGSMAFIAIGLALSAAGFSLWYTKLQRHQDGIVRDEANRYINEQRTRIHQVQFEKEFGVYDELWKSLVELKEGLKGLHLRFFLAKGKDTFESEKKALQKAFDVLYGRCDAIYKNNEPFYSDEVHRLVSLFVPHILAEGTLLFMDKKRHDESLAAIRDAEIKIDEICLAIRKRIGTIEKA